MIFIYNCVAYIVSNPMFTLNFQIGQQYKYCDISNFTPNIKPSLKLYLSFNTFAEAERVNLIQFFEENQIKVSPLFLSSTPS